MPGYNNEEPCWQKVQCLNIDDEISFAKCVNEDWANNEAKCFKKHKCSNDDFNKRAEERCEKHQDCWEKDRCSEPAPPTTANPAAEVQASTGDPTVHDTAQDAATHASAAQVETEVDAQND